MKLTTTKHGALYTCCCLFAEYALKYRLKWIQRDKLFVFQYLEKGTCDCVINGFLNNESIKITTKKIWHNTDSSKVLSTHHICARPW